MKGKPNQGSDSKSPWQKTSYSNLIRYVPSGVYFARIRIGGKLIRRSLRTNQLTVAKLKLADLEREERRQREGSTQIDQSKVLFGDLTRDYCQQLESNPAIKPRTRQYRYERIKAMLKSWPELERKDVRRLTAEECRQWAASYLPRVSPTNYNNTIGTLRLILDLAVSRGVRYSNPAQDLKRTKVKPKDLTLPSQSEFQELVNELRRFRFGPCQSAADLVEFLAYGGFRRSEAAWVTWGDVDLNKQVILVRGEPEGGTKNGEYRRVPIIDSMKALLNSIRSKRSQDDLNPDQPVMKVKECQGILNRACREVKITRITHHDLRHLFATRCIESGVDIPTVSRWLGHKDGGALAMKVYGHLRDQHSTAMAKLVNF